MDGTVTIRARVLELLVRVPEPMTATNICKELNVPDGISDFVGVELATLSGVLKKMYDAGELRRVDNWGPRGGCGYQVNHT